MKKIEVLNRGYLQYLLYTGYGKAHRQDRGMSHQDLVLHDNLAPGAPNDCFFVKPEYLFGEADIV